MGRLRRGEARLRLGYGGRGGGWQMQLAGTVASPKEPWIQGSRDPLSEALTRHYCKIYLKLNA